MTPDTWAVLLLSAILIVLGLVLWQVAGWQRTFRRELHADLRMVSSHLMRLETISDLIAMAIEEERERATKRAEHDGKILGLVDNGWSSLHTVREETQQSRLTLADMLDELRDIERLLDEKTPRLMEMPAPPPKPIAISPEDRPVTWADLRKAGEARRRREAEEAEVKRRRETEEALKALAQAEAVKRDAAAQTHFRDMRDHIEETLDSRPLREVLNPDSWRTVRGEQDEPGVQEVSNSDSRRTTRMDDILRLAGEHAEPEE